MDYDRLCLEGRIRNVTLHCLGREKIESKFASGAPLRGATMLADIETTSPGLYTKSGSRERMHR